MNIEQYYSAELHDDNYVAESGKLKLIEEPL